MPEELPMDTEVKMVKVRNLLENGNIAMEQSAYERAIEFYSQALLISDLSNEEKGLLYSNRSHAYLKSAIDEVPLGNDATQNEKLALQDAEKVIQLRPTWWKGYSGAAHVYRFKSEWELAIDMFDRALALNPELVELANYRDECRYDRSLVENGRANTNSNDMPNSFKEPINTLKKERGLNVDAKEITEKYEKLMKSNKRQERAMACLFFGTRYVQGVDASQDYKKGAELFQEAIDANVAEAMCLLGLLYMEGKGVRRNIQKAVSLFERAAQCEPKKGDGLGAFFGSQNCGITHGQFRIGICYEYGTGKPLDYHQAHLWYNKASNGGHAGAANNLAILYYSGHGVEKCSVKAKQYWSLAASRGNEVAMESLAWKHLEEKNFKEAQSWYTRALEAGNLNSVQNKDYFYETLKQARNDMEKLVNHFSASSTSTITLEEVKSEITNKLPPEISKLIDACSRMIEATSVIKYTTVADSPVEKYWTHLEEISRRAKNGHPYAQILLKSMGYFAEGLVYLESLISKKVKPEDIDNIQDQCILNLANCFRGTEVVAFLKPSKLTVLMNICKAKLSNKKSDLDLSARIVYSFLLMSSSQNSEILSLSEINCQKYPEEVFFYKIYAGAFAMRQDFKASMKVSDEGLKRFPKNDNLLFCRVGAMKMIDTFAADQIIAACKEFIKEAPFDQRSIPEVYYTMAFYSLDKEKGSKEEAKMYYIKAQEEEQKLLPCFIPCNSKVKDVVEALLSFRSKIDNHKNMMLKEQSNLKAKLSNPFELQLKNPRRLQFVLRHRETLRKMAEGSSGILSNRMCKVNFTVNPKNYQKMPKNVSDVKEITFRDMNPCRDHVYKKRVINLLIAEDPMFGLFPAIHVVVRDDNGDCLYCSFYELDDTDEDIRANLCFGSRISILNPYHRLAVDGSTALRVDEPKTIIYHSSGKENSICRYCWKENPQHACGRCKRAKYCSRDCQTDDWKVLKHKHICELKYFNGF